MEAKEKSKRIRMGRNDFDRLKNVPINKAFVMLGYQAKFNCKVIGFLADGQIVLRMEEENGTSLKYLPFKEMQKELLNYAK